MDGPVLPESIAPHRHGPMLALGGGLAVLGVLGCLACWLALRDTADRLDRARRDALRMEDILTQDISQRIKAMERIAGRWEASEGMPDSMFRYQAQVLMKDTPGFSGMAVLGTDHSLMEAVIQDGAAQSISLAPWPQPEDFLADQGRSGIFPAGGAEPVIILHVPLHVRGRLQGWLLARLDCAMWLWTALDHHLSDEMATGTFTVFLDGVLVGVPSVRTVSAIPGTDSSLAGDSGARGEGSRFQVRNSGSGVPPAFPSPQVLVTGGLGIFLGVLVSVLILLYQKASGENWKARVARFSLETEVEDHARTRALLEDRSARLQDILDGTNAGAWEWDVVTGTLEVNDSWRGMLGYRNRKDILHPELESIVHPDDLAGLQRILERHLQGLEEFLSTEIRVRHQGGYWLWVLIRGRVTGRDEMGRPLRMSGIQLDISDHKRLERALEESRELYMSILASMDDLVLVLDRQGIIVEVNQEIPFTSEGETDAKGAAFGEALPPGFARALKEPFQVLVESGSPGLAEFGDGPEGHRTWYQARLSALRDPDGSIRGATVVCRDISERKIREEEYRYQADHDALTGLPGPRLLHNRLERSLEQALQQKCKVGVLFMDLDDFKGVNDTLGHDAGDLVLKEVAARITRLVRKNDTVGRMGGDEFVMVLPGIDGMDIPLRIAREIVAALRRPFTLGDRAVQMGASVGVALYPEHGTDSGTILKQADNAMYRVKKQGRNGFLGAEPDGPA